MCTTNTPQKLIKAAEHLIEHGLLSEVLRTISIDFSYGKVNDTVEVQTVFYSILASVINVVDLHNTKLHNMLHTMINLAKNVDGPKHGIIDVFVATLSKPQFQSFTTWVFDFWQKIITPDVKDYFIEQLANNSDKIGVDELCDVLKWLTF